MCIRDRIDAVGRDLNAGYDKLAVALFIELGGLTHRGLYRQTAHSSACIGDYTV